MPRLVRKDAPSVAIIGICDLIPAVSFFAEVTSLDDIDYEGESRIHFDGQTHELRNGLKVYFDENEQEVLEDNVLLVEGEAE